MSTAELPIAKNSQARAIPKKQIDWAPLALLPIIVVLGFPLIGYFGSWDSAFSTWIGLTFAALAMGMIYFIIASGLTLIFGLMDVLNFGHGLFIAFGAFVAWTVLGLGPIQSMMIADNLFSNIGALLLAMLAAMVATGILGWIFEKVLIRRVYGLHLMQILITMGGMVVGEELIKVFWGPEQKPMLLPTALNGSVLLGDAVVEKFRLFAVVIGLIVFGVLMLVLNRTKVGLLIRAGVQDREMVESLGYRIKTLFIGVFITGAALAGLGGMMWGLYNQGIVPQLGAGVNTLVFIVIIIGGLGSTGGSFLAALLVSLVNTYTNYAIPKVALVSTILLMVVILAWRPNGLYKVTNR
ncbi:MAG: branched-chain amino acid ABC transporter permease [Proteobacteria bacterium]|nr:branched-chain amino acid ABC transporter permease [Pseudomonadota bacterium]